MRRRDLATLQLRRRLGHFARDESGFVTIFACFMIMMMVLVGGIGVDLMHNEMERTRLQNTLDRAVLAAADLDQTLDPSEVVADYFLKSGFTGTSASVLVDQGLNYRTVTARATTNHETQFMHLMGVAELDAPAVSTAEERISNVEISLVVDVSGSMAWNDKMENLQDAATIFVNTLLKPETEDLISISLVPYSEHVNIGQGIFDQLSTVHRHDYSYCVEMPDAEFDSAALDTSITYDQAQHFQWNYNGHANEIDDTVCPNEEFESIVAYSQDAAGLEANIAQFTPRAGTSIFMAVKWGAALLDPSTRDIVTGLISGGTVDNVFSGRPANYDDPETLKTMVVMTDGKNDRSNRIASDRYNSVSEYEHWDDYNFWYYMYNYIHSDQRSSWYWQKYTAAIGDTLTDAICTAAKDQGIIIWGVGFEVDDHGADVLESCASSPSHFFRVEGVEISEAFTAIASQINELRLTQ